MSQYRRKVLDSTAYCSKLLNISFERLLTCANGVRGNKLHYYSGKATLSLVPKLNYVPWINVNDEHRDEMQKEAESESLSRLITRVYQVSSRFKKFLLL